MLTLRTADLELIAADGALARAAADDAIDFPLTPQKPGFRALLNAQVGPYWPPAILADVQEHFAWVLQGDDASTGWWVWYLIHQEGTMRELVGAAGFAGKADAMSQVQIGYAIIEPYRNRGYATQAVNALIEWALQDPSVHRVVAETYPDLKASLRVIAKTGMTLLGPGQEPGAVRYARTRQPV